MRALFLCAFIACSPSEARIVVEVGGADGLPAMVTPAIPAPIEPELLGCSIKGSRAEFGGERLVFCAAPNEACFATLSRESRVSTQSMTLAEGPSIAARLTVSFLGVRLFGVVDAHTVLFHPSRLVLLSGFFVPTHVRLRPTFVHHGDVDIDVLPRPEVVPRIPIRVTRSCEELSLDDFEPTMDDLEAFLKLPPPKDVLELGRGMIELRQDPSGPVMAHIMGSDQLVEVYDHVAGQSRVLVQLVDGHALGWMDDQLLGPLVSGGHRARMPKLRMGATTLDKACAHDVEMYANVEGRSVHIGTIPAGVPFDPSKPHRELEGAGVAFSTTPFVRPEDVACALTTSSSGR